jgi:large subunit ribosomal protein L21e
MVKRMGGSRHKTRYKLSRAAGEHGRIRLTAFLQRFNDGDKVALIIDPSVQKGMFHPRHHGKTGTVMGSQGRSYQVKFNDKGKDKIAVVHPVHLKHV